MSRKSISIFSFKISVLNSIQTQNGVRVVRVMVLKATFNNISVISWPSVLLVEETGVLGETTELSQVTDRLKMFYGPL